MKYFLLGILSFNLVLSLQASTKPNLIVIMADDLGYTDVGFNGCTDILTPGIDSIAENGVKFTNGYTSYSVCGPSRAGFMTGRYQQRFGFERNPQWNLTDPHSALPKTEMTIAESLRQVGYHCGIIGKWHLGAEPSLRPNQRGFHEFFGHLGGGHAYFPEKLRIEKTVDVKNELESYVSFIERNDEPVKTTKYLTDEFSDEALRFVEKNQTKPFFLFLSYNAPHTPLQATQKYLDRFSHIKDRDRRTYCAMVSAMDDGISRLMQKLDELKIKENTLVFFLSDNGGPTTKNKSDNGPLKGAKGDVFEGGFRVPFAMQFPKELKAGLVYDKPVSSLDIFATIAQLSKAPLNAEKPLDGVNLIPYLTGEKQGEPHEQIYLRKFDSNRYAIRKGAYKMIIPWKGAPPQLYDLENDIGETKNIATKYPERVKELDSLLKQWDSELIDPIFLGLIHTEAWQKRRKKKK